jgi:hypothetical protein
VITGGLLPYWKASVLLNLQLISNEEVGKRQVQHIINWSEIIHISTTIKGNLTVQDKRKCIYSNYENNVKIILDKHAPLKTRYPRKNPLPCMNSKLRKAIHRIHVMFQLYKTKKWKNLEKI